jgi:hypothetical protein
MRSQQDQALVQGMPLKARCAIAIAALSRLGKRVVDEMLQVTDGILVVGS